MSAVERTELAPGLTVSRVLTGLWQIADLERDGKTLDAAATAAHMRPYVEAGFTTFDMADHYGSAELIAGCFGSSDTLGKQARMLTKWVPPPGPLTRAAVREGVMERLDRLQVEQLDLLQFHAWHYPDPSWLDSFFYLDELRQEGLVANLGTTNFDAAHLRIALTSGIPIVSNQVSFSLLDQRAAGPLAAVCEEFGTRLLAYGTLAGGFLSERWLGVQEPLDLATWSQMKYKRFIDSAGGWNAYQSVLAAVAEVAEKHSTSIATVSSRYMLDHPAVAGIILGARLGQSEHIEENLGIFNLQLDEEDRTSIGNTLAVLNPLPGDCGDEYRKPPFLTASGDLSDHLDSIPKVYDVQEGKNGKQRIQSGTSWETLAGYARAVRDGKRILVSGTTATHGERVVGGDDAAAQTHFVIDKIEGAIESLGGQLDDVVRTRIFVADIDDWEAVARAHGQRFAEILPANTLVEARLVGKPYLVEIEAEASLPD